MKKLKIRPYNVLGHSVMSANLIGFLSIALSILSFPAYAASSGSTAKPLSMMQKIASTYRINRHASPVSHKKFSLPYDVRANIAKDSVSGKPLTFTYIFQPNDSFSKVEKKLLNRQYSWNDLIRFNKITRPSRIKPGTPIAIPVNWLQHQPIGAVATSIEGDVLLNRARSGKQIKIDVPTPINVGDEISTLSGTLLVKFTNGTVIRIGKDARIIFNQLTQYTNTRISNTRMRLEYGHISTRVKPLTKGSHYVIETASAVAAVRGTAFRLKARGDKTSLEVTKGIVTFTPNNLSLQQALTATQFIKAGYAARISGGSISNNKALPPALNASKTKMEAAQFPITLKWDTKNNAKAYHYYLFKDSINGLILKDSALSSPSIQIQHLDNGNYIADMREIDQDGYESPDSLIYLNVNIHANPGNLISPANNSKLRRKNVVFVWNNTQPGTYSRLELALDPNFTQIVSTSAYLAAEKTTPPKGLPPGKYYWRVQNRVDTNHVALSKVRKIIIKVPLGSPDIIASQYKNRQVQILWTPIPKAQSYQVQVSLNKNFTTIVKEFTFHRSIANIKLDNGKQYYVRIKAIGNGLWLSRYGKTKILALR